MHEIAGLDAWNRMTRQAAGDRTIDGESGGSSTPRCFGVFSQRRAALMIDFR
jgi:hypothetical protein